MPNLRKRASWLPRVARAALALLVLTGCKRSSGDEPKDEVIYVKNDDPKMSAAIAKAQGSLETFRAALAAPPADAKSFSVKVGFAWGTKGDREHIWLADPKLDATTVTGTVNNEPVDVTTLKLGQSVRAPLKDVSDWMYVEGGVLRGGYTLRVLLDKMAPEAKQKMLGEMGFRLE
ncbi:MAG TPA: DUF2314 domain-containing protein [Polyangiaceae bacterium]|nr:DUF2314 domain-containing protein [Polyangiaceae bacterium]